MVSLFTTFSEVVAITFLKIDGLAMICKALGK